MGTDFATAKAMQQRALTKAAQTLLGICSGISADGQINDREIIFLRSWLTENAEAASVWPGSAIARRIDEILADGIITQDERDSLLDSLRQLSGNHFTETGSSTPAAPALPIDDDPTIHFQNMTFCFTGNFHFGTRAACERAVLKLEGMPVDTVTGKLNYLVIGSVVSEHWVNSTYGRKIELALERQQRYGQPAIISEAQWAEAIVEACRT